MDIIQEQDRYERHDTSVADVYRDGRVRLGTLVLIRWLAVIGQLSSLLFVYFILDFSVPIYLTISAVGISAALNLWLSFQADMNRRLTDKEAAGQLAFDLLHLTFLLFFTGGLANPFAILLLAPTSVSASILGQRSTKSLIFLAITAITALAFTPYSLPWNGEAPIVHPMIKAGLWIGGTFTIIFIAVYMAKVSSEGRNHARALAATQIALEREQKLSALGTLAAAAAHELGTPLGTIMLASKELLDTWQGDELTRADLELIYSETTRCRNILSQLREERRAGNTDHFTRVTLESLIREAASPHEGRGNVSIEYHVNDQTDHLIIKKLPHLVHAIRNIIENAVGYANSVVDITIEKDNTHFWVSVEDDGPGFDPQILKTLGEPYVSTRQPTPGKDGGLGLGLFIAKTLLEQSGAQLVFESAGRELISPGARVVISWPIAMLEDEKRT
ncbi:ActS/PrrB/RegB family redox-sensitive histidine kinase [Kordiimonas sp. SCSIO 12610]|uniref:ActS/PrrB/RegB family redox-sensitive histidine kinase n=1 Tax=Kordiimonas sp. SCSIO 12610 TaxID=2829597 RepID=UPI00210B270A|nr:ActS/PrrB/RegB family redox-sensitive histidine kinase [Kordiimonas sp. SCSIO 12610]UTW55077.1 ActS/PrrB/RegB family redox-sensitive histidine kinase [Kordiimonas sp. SCSIO 12610]